MTTSEPTATAAGCGNPNHGNDCTPFLPPAATKPEHVRRPGDPYLYQQDGTPVLCYCGEQASELTFYGNTGWQVECSDHYEANYDFNT